MLKIYQYFAIASGLLLAGALLLLAWFYNREASADLMQMTERQNIAIDRILANVLWPDLQGHLGQQRPGQTPDVVPEDFTTLVADRIQDVIQDTPILKVKIYGPQKRVLFSTSAAEIGEDASDNLTMLRVMREARPVSAMTFKDQLTAFSGEVFERDVVETYAPRIGRGGEVAAVFEVYSDVTDAKRQIDATTLRITIGLAVALSLVYVILVVGIMRRALAPIGLASRRAAKIGPDTPGIRLPTAGAPREILPLVRAINQALDRLDRALDAQRRFTSDAAHELLTPLAILRARIDALEPGLAEVFRRDIDGMTDLVHQLLYLADLEAHGRRGGIDERTELHALATEIASMLAPLAIRQGKQLALTGSTGPVWVQGSPRLLSRALRNLVENALRHTPRDTTVEIDLDRDGTLRVTDRGTGVPADQRDAIFERFWRASKNDGPGAGLGLSIMKRIVEGAGGTVLIEDAPGGGARFAMSLVRVEGPAAPAAGEAEGSLSRQA